MIEFFTEHLGTIIGVVTGLFAVPAAAAVAPRWANVKYFRLLGVILKTLLKATAMGKVKYIAQTADDCVDAFREGLNGKT